MLLSYHLHVYPLCLGSDSSIYAKTTGRELLAVLPQTEGRLAPDRGPSSLGMEQDVFWSTLAISQMQLI